MRYFAFLLLLSVACVQVRCVSDAIHPENRVEPTSSVKPSVSVTSSGSAQVVQSTTSTQTTQVADVWTPRLLVLLSFLREAVMGAAGYLVIGRPLRLMLNGLMTRMRPSSEVIPSKNGEM